MKLFDGILDTLMLNNADYDDDGYEDDYDDDVDDILKDEPTSKRFSSKKKTASRYEEEEEEDEPYGFKKSYATRNVEETPRKPKAKPQPINRGSGKLVPLNSAKGNKVFVIKPQDFNESQSVVDFLREDKIIVINMDGLDIDFAQRIIDFIGGACFAIDGTLQAVSRTIFIAAPNNTEVSGDLREEVLSAGNGISPDLHTNY